MTELRCSLLVIGGGPGGYTCASRAARMGVDTMLVEANRLGGTCLNIGCIPSKALIHAAQSLHLARRQAEGREYGLRMATPDIDFAETRAWMDGIVTRLASGVSSLMERSSVKTLNGWARFIDGKSVEIHGETDRAIVRADHIVIATGSVPTALPDLPFGEAVIDSTGALALKSPPDSMVVVGAGYIGLELGTAFAKLGSAVTFVEAADRILPQYDDKLTRPVRERLAELNVDLRLATQVSGWDGKANALQVESGNDRTAIAADKVLVTVGRVPNTERLALDELKLRMTGGFVEIDDHCRTSMRGVYAIGDVTQGPMLAHRAMAQGEIVADIVAGRTNVWDRICVPAVCFSDPEVVSVGLLPDQAEETNPVNVSEFSFRASGRALTLNDTVGFVRLVTRERDHVVLGVQAVGPGVSELAAGFALAIECGLRAEDVAATIHPHPTLSEAFQEAAMAISGMATHS